MKKSFIFSCVIVMISIALGSCEMNESEDNDDVKSVIVEDQSTELDVRDSNKVEYLIENYNNATWDMNEEAFSTIKNITILMEQYNSHKFNYSKLIEELGEHIDLPDTFIKADDTYGFVDPTDYTTIVTNRDTIGLTDEEFRSLLNELTFFSYRSGITLIDADQNAYEAIQTFKKRFYISSINEIDDNSLEIYLKEINTYGDEAKAILNFDSIITDYWFLYKKDIGKVYSHRKWTTEGDLLELDKDMIHMREQTFELEMFDITDSILNEIK